MKISRRKFLKLASFGSAAGVMATYPSFVELNTILTTNYRIPVPNLPPAFEGLRIVHVSDVHHGFMVTLDFVRDMMRQVKAAAGDLIVCTGDYVHGRCSRREIDAVWDLLAELSAPLGVYSILGNHDHWADTERSLARLRESGQDLYHKQTVIERGGERLWLVGAGDFWSERWPLDDELDGIPEAECRIVLAHNPDTADTSYQRRADLFISGHTHGGQVVLPIVGPPILPVLNKAYSSGLKKSPNGTGVFISRGIGWSLCPVRLNCFPEIAVLELTAAPVNRPAPTILSATEPLKA